MFKCSPFLPGGSDMHQAMLIFSILGRPGEHKYYRSNHSLSIDGNTHISDIKGEHKLANELTRSICPTRIAETFLNFRLLGGVGNMRRQA